ncbi:DUF4397 domain-containing protein [Jatrophihabitans sp. DSM 45814]
MTRLALRGFGVIVAAIGLTAVGTWFSAPTALAEPTSSAIVRAAHFSPDTPGVDIYLTAFAGGKTTLWVPNATYGAVSTYERINPGLYVVSMRAHGAPVSSPPVVSWNLNAQAGQAYTAAAIGANASLKTLVLRDDLSTPPAGMGRVRLVQGASRAPRASVVAVGGPVVADNAAFATTTAYATVPAGSWSVRAQSSAAGGPATSASLDVASGTVTSLLLLDAPGGGITLRTVVDAVGAATTPAGSVPAGAGGTALWSSMLSEGSGSSVGSPSLAAGLFALAGACVSLLVVARRDRKRQLLDGRAPALHNRAGRHRQYSAGTR